MKRIVLAVASGIFIGFGISSVGVIVIKLSGK